MKLQERFRDFQRSLICPVMKRHDGRRFCEYGDIRLFFDHENKLARAAMLETHTGENSGMMIMITMELQMRFQGSGSGCSV